MPSDGVTVTLARLTRVCCVHHSPYGVYRLAWVQVVLSKVNDAKEKTRKYAAESRVSISRLEDKIADFAAKVKAAEERVEKVAQQSTAGPTGGPR